MLAEAGAEVLEAELFEVLRLGRAGFVAQRLEVADQALVGDVGRQAERVRLVRVARVDALAPDAALALHEHAVVADQALDPAADLGVAQVQQVSGAIEAEAVALGGDGVAAGVAEAFVDFVAAAEVVRGRHSGQAGAQDLNRCMSHAAARNLHWYARAVKCARRTRP